MPPVEPASFQAKYKSLEVKIDDKASFTCQAQGEQPVNIVWFDLDNNQIQKSNKKFM